MLITSRREAFSSNAQDPVVRVCLELGLDPLDGEFDAISTVENGLACVASTIVLLPAVLAHVVVVAAFVTDVCNARSQGLVPHEANEG